MQPIQKLDNQLCFALYVSSKEIIRTYKTLLEPFGLTYTSYIVLLALWEEDEQTVKQLGQKLYLDSGTLSPVLKKLEEGGFVKRERNKGDDRSISITLTAKGKRTEGSALTIPKKMLALLTEDGRLDSGQIQALREQLKIVADILIGS
ncbi:MAG: MarR family transcriptional regulator [Spirochaetia bacterium]|jgi:DNA-binding MarR family transcriptional regulator|nr:MarR family transcriptional regulator [Spirochaetia bacterium]